MEITVITMLKQGLFLMGLGMGVVFVFLGVLVAAVRGMSALAMRLAPEPEPELPVTGSTPDNGAGVTAAISAAVHRYRQDHPR